MKINKYVLIVVLLFINIDIVIGQHNCIEEYTEVTKYHQVEDSVLINILDNLENEHFLNKKKFNRKGLARHISFNLIKEDTIIAYIFYATNSDLSTAKCDFNTYWQINAPKGSLYSSDREKILKTENTCVLDISGKLYYTEYKDVLDIKNIVECALIKEDSYKYKCNFCPNNRSKRRYPIRYYNYRIEYKKNEGLISSEMLDWTVR